MNELEESYREHREEIRERLKEFQTLRDVGERRWFRELVFVILSSRSSARDAWNAARELDSRGLLLEGTEEEVAEVLKKHDISYETDKARYIVENRETLSQPTLEDPSRGLKLKSRVDPEDPEKTRERLVEDLKGVGWKGASHFLRNVGYGDSFAIISRHILRRMEELDVIESAELPRNREDYMELERKFRELAGETGIEVQELDLLLWAMETGEVFR